MSSIQWTQLNWNWFWRHSHQWLEIEFLLWTTGPSGYRIQDNDYCYNIYCSFDFYDEKLYLSFFIYLHRKRTNEIFGFSLNSVLVCYLSNVFTHPHPPLTKLNDLTRTNVPLLMNSISFRFVPLDYRCFAGTKRSNVIK